MTDVTALGQAGHSTTPQANEVGDRRSQSRTQDLVLETIRAVAAAPLDLPFADVGDAFATWLAYHQLLNQIRRIAFRLVGPKHELVQLLRPWLQPARVTAVPRNAAGAAWLRAAQILERAPTAYFPSSKIDCERRGQVAAVEICDVLFPLAQLVLLLAAMGEALSQRLMDDAASVRSAALRLEARRLRRHAPRLATAAVDTLEKLRHLSVATTLQGQEPAPGPAVRDG